MELAEGTRVLGIRPVRQSKGRFPGKESKTMGKLALLIDLTFSINFMRRARFIRVLEHSEVGSGSSDTVLKRLDSIIDALRKERFILTLNEIGYK